MQSNLKAIEFFSGVGAFAQALSADQSCGLNVVEAFDQNSHANLVYQHNYGMKPNSKNLVSVTEEQVIDADLWWMSPPCTPFSRRGNQNDLDDPRARALLNLINLLGKKQPTYFLLENVSGFLPSRVYGILSKKLDELGYKWLTVELCSTEFGVPMRRPRVFVVASLNQSPSLPDKNKFLDDRILTDYLEESMRNVLSVEQATLERYRDVLNIIDVDNPDSKLICFTRGYHRCTTASGSLIRLRSKEVAYVAPTDIASLLGFSSQFSFPNDCPLKTQWKLIGNSVDVRAVRYLLSTVGLLK